MNEWPALLPGPAALPVISSLSLHSLGAFATGFTGEPPSSTWPSANTGLFIPFRLAMPVTVSKLWVLNGTAAAGDVDIGIYAPGETFDATPVRLVSIGPTAQAGTSAIQTFDITDTELAPGVYYLALVLSSTSGTVQARTGFNNSMLKVMGCAQQASVGTLPATATLATISNFTYIPVCGLLLAPRTVM